MRAHESKDFLGGIIASLSIPWGFDKGDEDLGGYHLVWPRDLVETAGALLAAGAPTEAVRVLRYLESTQEAAGQLGAESLARRATLTGAACRWTKPLSPSCCSICCAATPRLAWASWSAGGPWCAKLQVLSCATARSRSRIAGKKTRAILPSRWRRKFPRCSAAADIAELTGHPDAAPILRDTADAWNENIERWVYATGGELARQIGVEGYYVRIAPPDTDGAASPTQGFVPIKNRPPGENPERAFHIISPDALALVRFGLRAPDDPRILNTVKAVDALLRVQLPQGACWYRYNGDGYGEHKDGSPFNGTGIGRPWPLLAGERAHYEMAAGRTSEADALLTMMENCTVGHSRLLPEQVWDADDIASLELFRGKPTGSACPLVWAHSEYIKLRRSLRDGKIFDQPPQTVQRYQVEKPTRQSFWLED